MISLHHLLGKGLSNDTKSEDFAGASAGRAGDPASRLARAELASLPTLVAAISQSLQYHQPHLLQENSHGNRKEFHSAANLFPCRACHVHPAGLVSDCMSFEHSAHAEFA